MTLAKLSQLDRVKLFQQLEGELVRNCPELITEANDAADGVIDLLNASKQEIWEQLWDKPFFGNTVSKSAEDSIEKFKSVFVPSLFRMELDSADFGIEMKSDRKRDKNGQFTTKYSFQLTGARLIDVEDKKHFKKPRIYMAVAAGQWLCRFPETQIERLLYTPLDALVPWLQEELGRGWNHVTVMHFLTDCGICCNPDTHMVDAARYFELIAPKNSPDKKLSDALDLVSKVKALTKSLYGVQTGPRLRYVDKLLMEFGRKELIPRKQTK